MEREQHYVEAEQAYENNIQQALKGIESQGQIIAQSLRTRPDSKADTWLIASDRNPLTNIDLPDQRFAMPKEHQIFGPLDFRPKTQLRDADFNAFLGRLMMAQERQPGSPIPDLADVGGFAHLAKTRVFDGINRQAEASGSPTGYQEDVTNTATPGLSIVFARIPIERPVMGNEWRATGNFRRVIALRFSQEFKGLTRSQ